MRSTARDTEGGSAADADALLLAGFAAGDQSAARELTMRLTPPVMRQAWRMLGDRDEAEDIAQEAMLRLWRAASKWRAGEARVTTWLYRVTRNLCIDRIRRRRPTADIENVPEPVDPSMTELDRLVADEETRALAQAIGRLPERQRLALIGRHFDGLSNPEIAERLEASVEAVESLLARARRQLSRVMAGGKETDDDP